MANLGVLQARPRRNAQQALGRLAVAGCSEPPAQRNPDSTGCERPRSAGEAVSPPQAANGCLPGRTPARRLADEVRRSDEGAELCPRKNREGELSPLFRTVYAAHFIS